MDLDLYWIDGSVFSVGLYIYIYIYIFFFLVCVSCVVVDDTRIIPLEVTSRVLINNCALSNCGQFGAKISVIGCILDRWRTFH
jgi:hypothetical protein